MGQMEWAPLNGGRTLAGRMGATQVFLMLFFGQGRYRLDDLAAVLDAASRLQAKLKANSQ
jgi:hypothetical protein